MRPFWRPARHATRHTTFRVVAMGLLLPGLAFAQAGADAITPSAAADVWKYIAMVAMGGLLTAFVMGRNSVTRADLEKLKVELLESIKTQTPYSAVAGELWHRIKAVEERSETVSARSHDALNQAHAATGVLAIVTKLMDDVGALRERVVIAESRIPGL